MQVTHPKWGDEGLVRSQNLLTEELAASRFFVLFAIFLYVMCDHIRQVEGLQVICDADLELQLLLGQVE